MNNNTENPIDTIYETEGENKGKIKDRDVAYDIATSGSGEKGSRDREAVLERQANIGLTAEQEKINGVFEYMINKYKIPENEVKIDDETGSRYMFLRLPSLVNAPEVQGVLVSDKYSPLYLTTFQMMDAESKLRMFNKVKPGIDLEELIKTNQVISKFNWGPNVPAVEYYGVSPYAIPAAAVRGLDWSMPTITVAELPISESKTLACVTDGFKLYENMKEVNKPVEKSKDDILGELSQLNES